MALRPWCHGGVWYATLQAPEAFAGNFSILGRRRLGYAGLGGRV